MSYPQDTDDLLAGVGEFPPVSRYDLEGLIPKEYLDLGLGSGALTQWHTAAWEKVKRFFEIKGIDPDLITVEENLTKLKALTCHWVMEMLYSQNIITPQDHNAVRAKWHATRAVNIESALLVSMPSGKVGALGKSIELVRG